MRPERALRRAGGQVPGRVPRRTVHRVRDVRGVRAERIRRSVAGQRDGVRVRVPEASSAPERVGGDSCSRGNGRSARGVCRGRGRATASTLLAAQVRVVFGRRGRVWLIRVRRGADRASGTVPREPRTEEAAREESGRVGRQPAAGL